MNFQQLEYVLAVHQHKHFGEAAERCNITQATLSAMIRKLEDELGIIIFDRSRHPIKTTDIGLDFIQIAKKTLACRQDMQALRTTEDQTLKGNLRIGIIPTIANTFLPIVLPALLEKNPDVQLSIQEITTSEIIQQLRKDNIDIGILATPLEESDLDETILYYEPMMIYGVKDVKTKFMSSKDLQNKKIWLLEAGNCFREQSLTICDIKEKQIETSHLHFEGNSFDTLLNITDLFGGYTLIPELFYNTLPKNKKDITKLFEKPIPVREISIVSYRPIVKQNTIRILAKFIQDLIEPHLSTSNYAKKDLEIIGIHPN